MNADRSGECETLDSEDAATAEDVSLTLGCSVRFSRLKTVSLNGKVGEVVQLENEDGRVGVRLPSEKKVKLVKRQNLELLPGDGERDINEHPVLLDRSDVLDSAMSVRNMEEEVSIDCVKSVRLLETENDEWDYGGIRVVLGQHAHADQPALVRRITDMINEAYYEANKRFLHPSQTTYDRVDLEEVHDRLMMGAAGSVSANRVLLLAYVEDQLAGACSSTYSVPWAEDGCGHWGLLVTDKRMWGKGVGSALVAVAEHRVAGKCSEVRMEYEFVNGDPHSER